jgi:tetratricopeptide (TPR) repeat protein
VDKSSSAGRKLSVAMIARDADTTIAAALDSVRAIADEIIVVDTGSTDRTRQLARQRASKLLEFPWSDDFSAARNFALAHLSGDWVLWLDASEQIDPTSAAEIRLRLDTQQQGKQVYALLVQMPSGTGQVCGEQVAQIRLWPIRSGLKFAGRVREQLTPSPATAGLTFETTSWRIKRSPRDVSLPIKAEKGRRDIHLAELEMAERGTRPQLLTTLGESWAALGEPLQAADWFRRAVEQSPRASTDQLEAYYGLLTTFDGRPDARDEQIATCVKALEVFPLDAQMLCAMGSYMQSQGRLDLAGRSYQLAVEHGQINLHAWHLIDLAEFATVCFSLTLDLQSRAAEACQVLEKAIASRGGSERLRRQLIDLHIKHNRRREALAQAELLPDSDMHHDAMRNAIRGACLAAQQQWPGAMSYLQTAYQAGCHDPVCLRWLASGFIAAGNFHAAEPILRQWRIAAPESPEPLRLLASLPASRQTMEMNSGGADPAVRPTRWIDTTSSTGSPHLGANPVQVDGGTFVR